MVDTELLNTLQSLSYIAGATGVCIAAFYYIQILRNAEREKRRQTILMRLPAPSKEYYDCYYYLRYLLDWKTRQEYMEKHGNDPQVISKLMYLTNIYNTLGVLYMENLMSIEDIVKIYPPAGIMSIFERFEFYIPGNRKNSYGGDADPGYWVPFEALYRELKRKYPGIEGFVSSLEENKARRDRREVNVFSKM
jgi:hypothetical protein